MRIILLIIFFSGCARAPLTKQSDSMRLVKKTPEIFDSLTSENFINTLKIHIEMMKVSIKVSDPMIFGPVKIEKSKYIKALTEILDHQDHWPEWILTHFNFYEAYGGEKWGEVLCTGYYEPVVFGSLVKNDKFSQSLYSFPLGENNFSREEIDSQNKLNGKNLELVYLNPVDAFFVHIQGSATVTLQNGELFKVGFAGKNNYPYVAIGKYLQDIIPLKEMSMQKLKDHLNSLNKEEQQKIFNLNPSYIFFQKRLGPALTYAQMPVAAGRTIATDPRFFPKGALAFLDIEVFDDHLWVKSPRFVFDQDRGSAILGGGRVDLFFETGEKAAISAGVMNKKGRLYYLVPKNE